MSSINFDNIWWLLLAIPLIVLFTIPFALAVRKSNANGHNIAAYALNFLLAVLIAFSAAGTYINTVITKTEVYVVADVSYSANKNLDVIDGYIRGLSLPRNSKLGVVCFGKDYELLTELGGKFRSVKNADVDTSETNIVEALRYTGTLFDDDAIRKIVLITDGNQTDTSASNTLRSAVAELKTKNIEVNAIYLDDNIKSDVKEVQISGADYTSAAYLNNYEAVTVYLQCNGTSTDVPTINARLTLYRNGVRVKSDTVSLTAGINAVSVELDTSTEGLFQYEVKVETEDDTSSYNNSYYFTQSVSAQLNVLLVTDSRDDMRAVESLYGDKATIDSFVNNPEVPYTVEGLCKYDEIVLSNVDVTNLTHYTSFIDSLDKVVSLYGKGLIAIGDLGIQNTTEEIFEKLGDMLPVNYGNNGRDSKLYTIVIDTSRSMEYLYKLSKAKQAANQIVDMASDNDYICVVEFNGTVHPVQAPVKATARERIKELIYGLSVKNGTLIGSGLKEASELIKDLDFAEKQLFILSDGLSFGNEPYNPIEVTEDLVKSGIYTSAIDVGRGAGDETDKESQKGWQLMQDIASTGKGTYFDAREGEVVSKLIIKELGDEITDTVVEADSQISFKETRDEVLNGIDVRSDAWTLNGYVYASNKGGSTTVLTTEYQRSSGVSLTVPVYSYWKYGNGKVSAFTSGIGGAWVKDWSVRSSYQKFFDNLLATNLPNEKNEQPYSVSIERTGNVTNIQIVPAVLRSEGTATIKISLPDETEVAETMTYNGKGYRFALQSTQIGNYSIDITYSYAGNDYVTNTGLGVGYLAEYDEFAICEISVLHKAIDGFGAVSDDGKLDLSNDESEVETYNIELRVPLLIICVVLAVVEIVIRKLKWADVKSFFGRGGK